jgi:hypothetical protein
VEIDELKSDFSTLLNFSESIVDKATVNSNCPKEIIIAGLYIRILNGAKSINLLLENHYSIEAEIVVRSLSEHLFYMGACFNDKDAVRDFQGRFALNRSKEIGSIVKNNEHFGLNEDDINNLINKRNDLKAEIKRKDIKDRKVEDWAKMSGLLSLYYGYKMHSDAVHCDPMYLKDNIMKSNDGNIFQINIDDNDNRIEPVYFTTNVILSWANRWYCLLFNMGHNVNVYAVEAKYIGRGV